jgi:hypothetical protein
VSFCTRGRRIRTEARKAMLMQIVPTSGWRKKTTGLPIHRLISTRLVIARAAMYMVAGTRCRRINRQPTPA